MHCPLCNHHQFTIYLSHIHNPRAIGPKQFEYQLCTNCKLLTLIPQLSQEQLNSIYTEQYDLYQYPTKSLLTKIVELISIPRYKKILQYLQPQSKFLDVGCGNGTFLYELKQKNIHSYGTEWSKAAAQKAMQIVNKDSIYIGDLHTAPWKEKFDGVSLWHVLEHNLEPNKLIQQIKERLTKDGYLFIEVPNSNSLTLNKTKQNYAWFSIPEHVTYWNKQSLHYLAKQNGFQVLESKTPFSMPFLYAHSQKSAFSYALSPLLQIYATTTNQGDIIRQVWKKSQ